MKQQIRSIIAAAVNASVDWGSRPQGAPYPGVVLTTISGRGGHTFDGPDGLSVSRVQVDVYAERYGEAEGLSAQIRDALDGHQAGAIKGIFWQNERDYRENGETKKPYRISQDFEIHFAREEA